MAERPATSIPIESFRSDHDDFGEWIKLFESAVILATHATEEARKHDLFRQWLPIKLDARSRDVYGNCTKEAWDELKTEFQNLLIDPQEKYNWQARRTTIAWDGRESFHSLATRVKRSVNLYENPAVWEEQYFFRFRSALPYPYRKAIDLGCEEDGRTLENAKKCALRLQMALADGNNEDTAMARATGRPDADKPEKSVAFTGAALADDRLKAIELSLQEMSIRVDNVNSKLDEVSHSGDSRQSSRDRYESRYSGGHSSSRNPDRRDGSRDYRRDSSDRQGRWDSRDRYSRRDRYDSRDRQHGRDQDRRDSYDRRGGYASRDYRRGSPGRWNSQDRGRRGSRDHRDDYDNRRDSRGGRDYEYRDRRDSRDRRGNRGRWDSTDRRDGRDRVRRDDRGRSPSQSDRRSDPKDGNEYKLANLDPSLQWLYAAIAEKGQREQQPKN